MLRETGLLTLPTLDDPLLMPVCPPTTYLLPNFLALPYLDTYLARMAKHLTCVHTHIPTYLHARLQAGADPDRPSASPSPTWGSEKKIIEERHKVTS